MKNRSLKILATGAIGMLALAGCTAAEAETVGDGNADNKDLTIAVFNGWDEGIAASELWKAILDEKGYNVELEYADVAPVYAGLSTGDYDLNLDVWLPNTHKSYLEEYGDDITELGAWNDEAKNTIAVNADAPIDTLAELADNADLFDNRLVGIEPGAGLTEAVTDNTIPTYGLEDMDYQTSSTAAMLTELTAAEKSGENIAVTLWAPHWAYDTFDLKNLEDPEGTLGASETIHAYGKKDFSTDFPQATEWIADYTMDLDKLQSLEAAMFVDYDGQDYGPIVAKWIEDNQEYVDSLTA
ncbi:glycine betaine/proline transport system substrate-binding protein [Cryobacterium sp. MP_3.1]|uniref:Glycine/betaine ABC transporter substrate-binding protein n=1 Tax=Cryobacterium zongtaii TaxID=1259217 RepID=A0A2S3ZQX7_9MICO|nr:MULTISPECIES: glycine betaine ABC transporter substrate-binding protein [Cryobacterium]MEC5183768.1 glycine betaine/proline transport system substrate-binding protein [Cryobacterium sp. MP_3.1]POH71297.1 glycine/betaine ABC transporter substrate-binding protein [Cryobacterium zongtaii]